MALIEFIDEVVTAAEKEFKRTHVVPDQNTFYMNKNGDHHVCIIGAYIRSKHPQYFTKDKDHTLSSTNVADMFVKEVHAKFPDMSGEQIAIFRAQLGIGFMDGMEDNHSRPDVESEDLLFAYDKAFVLGEVVRTAKLFEDVDPEDVSDKNLSTENKGKEVKDGE